MDINRSSSTPIGVISGLTACFWLCFTSYWTYQYLQSQHQPRFSLKIDKSFHISALSYQFAAILFFTADCIYECLSTSISKGTVQACFILYLPLAYVMGMGCSLGFGTLYTKTSRGKRVVLLLVWTAVLISCLLTTFTTGSPHLTGTIIQICVFAFQIGTTAFTLYVVKQRYDQCEREGYAALAVSLHRSKRVLTLVLFLLFLLFVISTIPAITSAVFNSTSVQLTLWAGFIVATTVVDSWVLVIMRPSAALEDVSMIEAVVPSISHRFIP